MNRSEAVKEVFVYADWIGIDEPCLMGVLASERLRGKEVFSFEYNTKWLVQASAQMLDPDLQLFAGKQFIHHPSKTNFGLFLDSSPDRWGRMLMRRREAARARADGRKPFPVFETDYLLGVFDGHRMGGLRFKTDPDGPFLSDDKKQASPPWTSIRELEEISLRLEEDNISDDPDYLRWLNILIAPGSSLGGARPKASIENNGTLWIAKFPSKNDDSDMGAWEMVAYELARKAGINMADSLVQKFSSSHHTFLTRRFDRTKKGQRIHFASAMTLLGYMDGQDSAEGVSYLELAEFISNYSDDIPSDLEQLWRRIVFNICISNVDDHLRNHGFMLTERGWRLSPAYDINPVETGIGLKLNISEHDNALDLELALGVIPFFRISHQTAFNIMKVVRNAVNTWKDTARALGISKREIELKAQAFKYS